MQYQFLSQDVSYKKNTNMKNVIQRKILATSCREANLCYVSLYCTHMVHVPEYSSSYVFPLGSLMGKSIHGVVP